MLRRQFEAVRAVLNQDWNPIGVDGLPVDEYDAYVWPIVRLLRGGADQAALVKHLQKIEQTWFDSAVRPAQLAAVAAALLALGYKESDT